MTGKIYDSTWESLDHRPIPPWYEDAKIGILLHWGVYSVPGFGSEWFWHDWNEKKKSEHVHFMRENYPPDFTYQAFAKDFTAEFFEPKQWAKIIEQSGAKYAILTTKHHDGYTLWPSKHSFCWNAKDVGPNRDLVGELADAIRDKNLRFGVYYSLYEWFHPLYLNDKASGFKENAYVENKVLPELKDIVNRYKPDIVWSDGERGPDTYWQSEKFLAWLYNESMVKSHVVTNDRWGEHTICTHGGFYTAYGEVSDKLQAYHKWENVTKLDKKSWGYRRDACLSDFLTFDELIQEIVKTVATGGNILINIGPTKDGMIAPIFQDRLSTMGDWLRKNGVAIYKTRMWVQQNDRNNKNIWYTFRPDLNCVYAIHMGFPSDAAIKMLNCGNLFKTGSTKVRSLDGHYFDWSFLDDEETCVEIKLTNFSVFTESKGAWVLEIKTPVF